MKNLWMSVMLILGCTFWAQCQSVDSTTAKRLLNDAVGQIAKVIEKSAAIQQDSTIKNPTPYPSVSLNKPMVNLLTMMPFLFYIITLVVVGNKLKKEGSKLSWFLLDKELLTQLSKQDAQVETARLQAIAKAATIEIAEVAANAPSPFQSDGSDGENITRPEEGKESVSRLIALLTGLITLGIACCLTSFYIYKCFTGHPAIDLSKLTTVLYGLGLGLVPYGFTKVSGALKG